MSKSKNTFVLRKIIETKGYNTFVRRSADNDAIMTVMEYINFIVYSWYMQLMANRIHDGSELFFAISRMSLRTIYCRRTNWYIYLEISITCATLFLSSPKIITDNIFFSIVICGKDHLKVTLQGRGSNDLNFKVRLN
jgi:hypothetical protein